MNNEILFPFYDNIHNPSEILSYAVITGEGKVDVYNNVERPDTPYWRLHRRSIGELLDKDLFIFNKKNLYKIYDNKMYHNLVNVNTSLWHNDHEPIKLDYNNYQRKPVNYFINQLLDKLNISDLAKVNEKYDYLVKACSILDGVVSINNKNIRKTFDHYTSGARLRDTTGNTLSMKKEIRKRVKTKGIKIEMDMDSFHLRILNTFIDGKMPKEMRGHDWIIQQAGMDENMENPKREIFRAIYSEKFHLIDCEFFNKLIRKHKSIKSPFGRTHNNFNYVIQEYESYLMSKIISAINVDYIDFLFYLYDGLIIDLKDPTKVKEFILLLKEKINLPFTVKVGTLEKRFY